MGTLSIFAIILYAIIRKAFTRKLTCQIHSVVSLTLFGPKRDENGECRRLHNEKLHSLYRSPNIVRLIKSRRLRWAGHVARLEDGRSPFKILTGKPTGKRQD